MMTSAYLAWLRLFGAIAKERQSLEHERCPRCGEAQLKAQYVASPEGRTGYAALWCENCWHGIWISRAVVPDGWTYATFEEAEAGIIPRFASIEPEESSGARSGRG